MSRIRMPVIACSWRLPLSIALVIVTAVAWVENAIIVTPALAPQPADSGLFGPAGAEILRGQWAGVFDDKVIQAGALELIFWGVPELIGVTGVTGWILFEIVVGIALSVVLAWLVERLLRPLTATWTVPLALAVAAMAALSGVTTRSTSVGHPAEFVIPLMWVVSAVLARRGAALAAVCVLAATAGWELWGLLGVPVLLLAPRIRWRTVWVSALGGTTVLAVLFLPFVVLGPFHMFSFAWGVSDGSLARLLFANERTFAWPLRLVQGVLAVGSGAVAARFSRGLWDSIWLVPLGICAVRLFTDPVLAGYYAIPSLLMLLIGAVFAVAQRSLWAVILCLLMFNLLTDLPMTLITLGALVVLVVTTTVVVVRRERRRANVDRPFSRTADTAYDGEHGGSRNR